MGTLNEGRGSNIKYLPYAFTEQGVAMLSGILRSKIAIEVNIRIMRAFVSMRHFMVNHTTIFQRLETIEFNQLESKRCKQRSCLIKKNKISVLMKFSADLMREMCSRSKVSFLTTKFMMHIPLFQN